MNAQMERPDGQSYETDPHNVGLNSVVEGEEGDQRHRDNDHEKKSVLKKVKAKARKFKDTFMKHAHGHDNDHGVEQHDQGEEEGDDDDDEKMDEDLVVHAHTVSGDQQTNAPNLGNLVPGQEDDMNPSRMTGDTTEQQGVSRQLHDDIGKPVDLKEDANAPGAGEEAEKHQSEVVDPTGHGGKEVGITPILGSFDKMKIYDEKTEKSQPTDGQDEAICNPSHDQFILEPVSGETTMSETEQKAEAKGEGMHQQERGYTEKIAAATSLIVDKAAQATQTVASKLGYGTADESPPATGEEAKPAAKSASVMEYGEKAVTTVQEKLASVFGNVADAKPKGHDTGGQNEQGSEVQNKGVAVKGYIAEKLKPGEEDEALAEAIFGTQHKPKEEAKGRLTESEEEVQRLGKTDERAEEQTGSPGKGTGVDQTGSPEYQTGSPGKGTGVDQTGSPGYQTGSPGKGTGVDQTGSPGYQTGSPGKGTGVDQTGSPGKGTVDKFKSAVTSWFGRGGETHPGKGEDDQGKEDDRTGVESTE
ncbi:hypothetical protein Drorol1_Dr00013224 [Drosera rotundifolia]